MAKLCQQAGIAHIINNAYGVQSAALCAQVCSAWRKGRVDAVVQSTDKNFHVPVGGAIIAARRGATQLVSGEQPGTPAALQQKGQLEGSLRAVKRTPPCLPS